jgi:hypothetical protein
MHPLRQTSKALLDAGEVVGMRIVPFIEDELFKFDQQWRDRHGTS